MNRKSVPIIFWLLINLLATTAVTLAADLQLRLLLPKDSAQFHYAIFLNPYGVAVDGSGNMYVADTSNNRIQKFDAAGNFVTQWGSQGSGDDQLYSPYGVAVDGSGNFVYVADTSNNRIQKFTSAGAPVTRWGSAGSDPGQFTAPQGVAVDGSGIVYVADTWNNRIQKFTSTGTPLAQWGSSGDLLGQFSNPAGVAVGQGYVYVADYGNNASSGSTL